jgi:hypothetical protein
MPTPYTCPQAAADKRLLVKEKHSTAPLLINVRQELTFARAEPTEVLPQGARPASLAGQLRLLELQRDSLTREIDGLRAQIAAVVAGQRQ